MNVLVATDNTPSVRTRGAWSVERLCLVGAVVSVCFVTYISLVPFDLHLSSADLGPGFLTRVETRIVSRTNFLANIALFVPVAFLLAGAVRRSRSEGARMATVLLVAIALSVLIEALQLFAPHRTPSIVDVAAHVVGSVIGFMIWRFTREEVRRWTDRASDIHGGSLVTVLLTGYALGRVLSLLWPLEVTVGLDAIAAKVRTGGVRLVPAVYSSDMAEWIRDAAATILWSIPIGILAAVRWMGSSRRFKPVPAFVSGAAFLALVEVAQIFVVSRVADVTDVLIGAIGVGVGVLATRPHVGLGAEHAQGRAVQWGRLAVGCAVGVLYVVYQWGPFDFDLNPDVVRPRLEMLAGAPFSTYYAGAEIHSLEVFLTKVVVAFMLGVAMRVAGVRVGDSPRLWWLVVLVLSAAFFSIVEFGQVLLPGRYPDNTDVLIAELGFMSGLSFAACVARLRAPAAVQR